MYVDNDNGPKWKQLRGQPLPFNQQISAFVMESGHTKMYYPNQSLTYGLRVFYVTATLAHKLPILKLSKIIKHKLLIPSKPPLSISSGPMHKILLHSQCT